MPNNFFFRPEQLLELQKGKIPQHVAILMDGNRRWARQKLGNCDPSVGHWSGARVLLDVVLAAAEMGVDYLTVYALSTENYHRSKLEVDSLHKIIETYLVKNRRKMVDCGVKFSAIGRLEDLPKSLQNEIQKSVEATCDQNNIELIVALNYGGRDELRRAFCQLARMYKEDQISLNQITEQRISNFLDTGGRPDPDLVIRTSMERRLSNFLLWQIAYAELYHTTTFWPDFSPNDLMIAIKDYQSRNRRMGK